MNQVVCTNCQQSIGYTDKHAGKFAKCPKCKSAVQLPPLILTVTPVEVEPLIVEPIAVEPLTVEPIGAEPLAFDPFDDVPDHQVQPTSLQGYGRSKKRRRSGKKNWLLWGLISGGLVLFAIVVVAVTLLLTSDIFSPTPESVFLSWRQAMKNDDYGTLYDLLCDEGKAELDPAIQKAARRRFTNPDETAGLSGRALFCKLAERKNLIITNRPDMVVRARSLMYGNVELTDIEIEEEKQEAYVYFNYVGEIQPIKPPNINGKRMFLNLNGNIYFNYLGLTKQDGTWKLANPRVVALVLNQ